MSRRILATVVASLMLFALLPATAAFAQANATAELASGDHVRFPGDHTYTITVRNTEPQLIGRTINAVEIYLPVIGSGVVFNGPPPNQGSWTAYPTKAGSTQYVTYFGGSIAPQGSATFQIPATVLRPFRADLASDFVVKVSSDRFATSLNAQPAGQNALTAAVEALEILPDTLEPVAPTNPDNTKGVTDGSGTGGTAGQNGQTVTYQFRVKNHARESLNVTGSLVADNDLETPGAPVTKSISGNDGTATFVTPVTLGPAPTANRTVEFSAHAVAPKADADPQEDTFTVHRPVGLDFTGLSPTRVNSGSGSARQFNVSVQKTGGAGFDLTGGALEFAGNSATLTNAPVRFQTGTRNANLAYQIAEISGADNDYAASIRSIGSDDNLADYQLNFDIGLITIDNLIPTFELQPPVLGDNGLDRDGDELAAATNGTQISVSGKALGDDLVGSSLEVTLASNGGDTIPVSVTQTTESDGISFTGSVSGSDVAWNANANRFVVVAQIRDQADNAGTAETSFTPVDTERPVLDLDSGVILSPTQIRLQFDDATGIRGGCDPRSWRVDGTAGRVEDVRTSSGKSCFRDESGEDPGSARQRARALSSDGVRVLVLNTELGWDDTPPVTYAVPVNVDASRTLDMYPVKDGAANYADEQTISTVTDLVPPAPNIVGDLLRPDHETGELEVATHDKEEDRYYTNVGGDNAIRATITGVRENYKIQVLDGQGNVLKEYAGRDRPTLEPLATEWNQDIDIPLGTSDSAYVRGVRLISTVGNASPQTKVTIVLDTVLPTFAESVQTGPSEGLAHFAEKIAAPVNNNPTAHWRVRWVMEGQNGPEVARTQPQVVEHIDDLTRRVTWDFEVQTFDGFDYRLQPGTTDPRYEDRAGNYMLDTFGSEPIE